MREVADKSRTKGVEGTVAVVGIIHQMRGITTPRGGDELRDRRSGRHRNRVRVRDRGVVVAGNRRVTGGGRYELYFSVLGM